MLIFVLSIHLMQICTLWKENNKSLKMNRLMTNIIFYRKRLECKEVQYIIWINIKAFESLCRKMCKKVKKIYPQHWNVLGYIRVQWSTQRVKVKLWNYKINYITSMSLLACSRNTWAYSFTSFSLPFLAASIRTRRGTLVSRKESETWSITALRSYGARFRN